MHCQAGIKPLFRTLNPTGRTLGDNQGTGAKNSAGALAQRRESSLRRHAVDDDDDPAYAGKLGWEP
jgi:hypothetical protein